MDSSAAGIRLLRGTALGAALAFIGLYLILAGLRLNHPFELEWMEGGIVDQVQRLVSGQGLYVEPSLGFVPFVYSPLYFHVVALVAQVTGVGFLPARLVSVAASLGCLVLIVHLVRRRTDDLRAGVLAAGLFAACYRAGGAWLDIARPDTLSLVLALWGLAVAAGAQGGRGAAWAGVLFALACLSKQSAVFVAAMVAVWWLFQRRRQALYGIGALLAVLVATTVWFQWVSSGWYLYYVWQVPRHHPVDWERMVLFWRDDLLALLPMAMLSGAAVLDARRDRPPRSRLGPVAFGAAGFILSSWLVRVRTGSYDNVLLPAFAGMALLFGLGLHAILDKVRAGGERGLPRFEALAWTACILQFLILAYDLRDQIPSAADRAAGRRLVARLEAIDGDVYIPAHGYLPAMAGKSTSAHWIAVADVLNAGGPVADRLEAQIAAAIDRQAFAAVIADRRLPPFLQLDESYISAEETSLMDEDDVFWPVTGYHTRPERILVPIHATDRLESAPTPAPDGTGEEGE